MELDVDPCIAVAHDEVRRLVAIELGALLADSADAGGNRTRVDVGCRAGLVELRVDDPMTGKTLARTIRLEQVAAGARSRLLALAITELVVASWTELETNPEPAAVPATPRPSPELRRAVLASVQRHKPMLQRRVRWLAVGGGLAFFSGSGFLWGGGLRVAQDLPRHLGWSVDALANHGSGAASLGAVSVDTVSVGAALLVHWDWPSVILRGGVGLRGGAAHLAGEPRVREAAQARAGWGGWAGPCAAASVTIAPARRLAVELAVESGYAVIGVQGIVAGKSEVAVDGAWLGIHLGIGFF